MSGTILVVETNDLVCDVLVRMLEAAAYRVLTATNGGQALAQLAENGEVDVVLTEVILPGMRVRTLAEQIAEEHPRTRVLYMSGDLDETLERCGIDPSSHVLLRKPFSPSSLLENIDRILVSHSPKKTSFHARLVRGRTVDA